jgi:replicative DNA helicase
MQLPNLPNSFEAERALLGTMVGQGYFDQEVLLAADDFYSDAHRRIYRTMTELADAGESVDCASLVEALRRKEELEKVGGASYVAALPDGLPLAVSLGSWEKVVRESAIRRRLMQAAHALSELAATDDFEKLAHDVEGMRSLIEARKETEVDGSLEAIEGEYAEYVRNLDALSIHFGIRELDERTGGFQLGEVVTLIARTGVGKSAIAQNVIKNVLARYPDSGVAFFSLEMPRLQAFERQLQIHSGKTRDDVIWAYRRGDRSAAEEFLARCKDRLAIIDTPGISLSEIQRRVSAMQALKRVKPVRLVVIDYLGYLGGGSRNASLVERTSELARGVKRLAKDLGAVVFLIAQTSRHAGDGSEEVTVTDGRDSGAIEDSADFLIGCWRPELAAGLKAEDFMEIEGQLRFRILKARRGMQARFEARFEGETLRVLEPGAKRVSIP